jgi:DNA replication and repair protein RecF
VQSRLLSLLLADFRSYERATLDMAGRSVFLVGPNGAGKTNLLEAISFFSPGRGLRGAALAQVGRRMPGEARGRPWAVSALLGVGDEEIRLGSGVEQADSPRRLVRIDGEAAPPGRLSDHVRPLWLTPAQDRLFLDGAAERRRFFDRLVFAAQPDHAAHVGAYERALRERMRLLADGDADDAWLVALEARMGHFGALTARARADTVGALQAEIEARGERPFPRARLEVSGEWMSLAASGAALETVAARLGTALAAGRASDAAAGRTLIGPHRGDLIVRHAEKDRPADECSTGEQKALILSLVLAQAARLSRAKDAPNPILLLDEVAAHLDLVRRAALFDEIEALALQAFLSGTDESLFASLKGRAMGVHVDASRLTVLDD